MDLSTPTIEFSGRTSPFSEESSLPDIKSLNGQLKPPIIRNRSNSIGASSGMITPVPKDTKPASLFSMVPNSKVASFTDGKLEIEKAYQMVRYLRKENEDYQVELNREKEHNLELQVKIREIQKDFQDLQEEKTNLATQLESAEEKLRDQELVLLQERRKGAEKLDSMLQKQSQLETELAQAQHSINNLTGQLTAVINRVSFKHYANNQNNRNTSPDAPLGKVAVVFTDVESSTEKWERNPELMQQCLMLHNELIRNKIKQFEGYEVKTEGDSFMVAFWSPINAAKFCIEIQRGLLELQWPEELINWPGCKEERRGGKLIWRGMRVRTGAHLGVPTCAIDPTTGRMDYLGSMVNKTSRISGMAAGGQVLISHEMWESIKDELLDVNLDIKDIGSYQLKGMVEQTKLKQILPVELAERTFPQPKKAQNANALEHQLKSLVKENERLRNHLNTLENEFKQMMNLSNQMEKKYSKVHLQKDLSSHSLHELLQAAVWNEAIHSQFSSIKQKIAEYHKDTELIKLQLSDVIEQKTKLSEERDDLLQKLSSAELEKKKLLEELASRPETPVSMRPRSPLAPPRNTPNESSPRLEREQQMMETQVKLKKKKQMSSKSPPRIRPPPLQISKSSPFTSKTPSIANPFNSSRSREYKTSPKESEAPKPVPEFTRTDFLSPTSRIPQRPITAIVHNKQNTALQNVNLKNFNFSDLAGPAEKRRQVVPSIDP